MKYSDFQIGDYVRYQGHIYIIEEISAKGWVHLIYTDTKVRVNMASDYIIDLLEPIPFTEVMAKKIGFTLHEEENMPKCWRYTEDDGIISIEFEPEILTLKVWNGGANSPIKEVNYYTEDNTIYFHELQHSLRQCGLSVLADNLQLED